MKKLLSNEFDDMITKRKLRKHLKEKYNLSGTEFYFLTRDIAKRFGVSSHSLTHAVLKLEADGAIERFNQSNRIRWRTCFGKKGN